MPSRRRPTAIDCNLVLASVAVSAVLCGTPMAQGGDTADKPPFKLTLGGYHFAETGNAVDINLRHTDDFGNKWLGYYDSPRRGEHQARAGWDNTFELKMLRFTPS